jgi:hypothetical protein
MRPESAESGSLDRAAGLLRNEPNRIRPESDQSRSLDRAAGVLRNEPNGIPPPSLLTSGQLTGRPPFCETNPTGCTLSPLRMGHRKGLPVFCETNPTGFPPSLLTLGQLTGRPVFCETNPTGFVLGSDASHPEFRGLRAHGVFVIFGKHRKFRVFTLAARWGSDHSGATRQHLRAPRVKAGNPSFPIIPAPHVYP